MRPENNDGRPVLIIGATNRPDSLDPALRRAGRFEKEICLTVPDEEAREKILRVMCQKLRLSGDFDFHNLAKKTPGYVGADLMALTAEAGRAAINRIFKTLKDDPTPKPQLQITNGVEEVDEMVNGDVNGDIDMDMDLDGPIERTVDTEEPEKPEQNLTVVDVSLPFFAHCVNAQCTLFTSLIYQY